MKNQFEGEEWKGEQKLIQTTTVRYHADIGLSADAVFEAVARHRSGDWGECTESEIEANAAALEFGVGCVISRFRRDDGSAYYVITQNLLEEWPNTHLLTEKHYAVLARCMSSPSDTSEVFYFKG